MKKIIVFLADGFEEVEALTCVDLLRRAGAQVIAMSVNDKVSVEGAHDIEVVADTVFDKDEIRDADAIVLPGGMPGTLNLKNSPDIEETVKDFYKNNRLICAICAAPMIPGSLGMLKGREACCYPGMEEHLTGADVKHDLVCRDGNIITGAGVGGAIAFALEIIEYLFGAEDARNIRESIVYRF